MRREAGGPSEGLRLIVRGYLRAGDEVEIATLDASLDASADLAIPMHALGREGMKYGYSRKLRTFLHENASRFDGIVIHGLWQYQGLAALQELHGQHPYAVFPHGMLDPYFNRAFPLKLLKKLPYWFLVERNLLAGARAVLFTSSAEARLARNSFPLAQWRTEVVPYGTMGPVGSALGDFEAFHARLPQLVGWPFILFAGRLHPKKGCDMLLQAYAQVVRQAHLPTLVMAGPDQVGLSGKLRGLARDLGIADKVLWPGMLTGAEKWGAFRAADAFILPSHQENFGIAVAESLSCGTPVLISDQVNIHGDVSASDAGLVEPDTVAGTARLLMRWAAMSTRERDEMSGRAMQCWRHRFDSSGTARAITRLFREESHTPRGGVMRPAGPSAQHPA